MDPWSKEELLTEPPGGNHGDGGPSKDQSFLRQGAGIGTSADSDLWITMAVEQWCRSLKGVLIEGFQNGV